MLDARLLLLALVVIPAHATVACGAVTPSTPATTETQVDATERLRQEIGRLSTIAGGKVGVSIFHLESGHHLDVHGDDPFPMASTYKVPIAVQLLQRVLDEELSLDDRIAIGRGDLHPGSGTLAQEFAGDQIEVSVRILLEKMLIISDNSATDLMLRAAGGPAQVTARMRTIGIEDIRVDRSTLALISDWVGIEDLPDERSVDPETFRSLYQNVEEADRQRAAQEFADDPRDTSSPNAMCELLVQIWRNEALPREMSEILLDIMGRCETGQNRLLGRLPPDTKVLHKTGTIGGSTNDVGIIQLPDDLGHIAIAAFVRDSQKEIPVRERAIAEIARSAYDFFVFHAPEGNR